jgi:hypothetical protein
VWSRERLGGIFESVLLMNNFYHVVYFTFYSRKKKKEKRKKKKKKSGEKGCVDDAEKPKTKTKQFFRCGFSHQSMWDGLESVEQLIKRPCGAAWICIVYWLSVS